MFGSHKDFHSITKNQKIVNQGNIHLLDQRNHGNSPHTENFSVEICAQDTIDYIKQNNIQKTNLVGYSMGAFIAMEVALRKPNLINSLLIIDMAPRDFLTKGKYKSMERYQDHSTNLSLIDLENLNEEEVKEKIFEACGGSKLNFEYYLENLEKGKNGKFKWKCNLKIISDNFQKIAMYRPEEGLKFEGKCLWVVGDRSKITNGYDYRELNEWFPNFDPKRDKKILSGGHFVHFEDEEGFCDLFEKFNKELDK